MILSEKRAAQAARGIAMGEGSSLLESQTVLDNLEDTLYWTNLGLTMDLADIDFRLAGALSKEAYNRGTNLITGITQSYAVGQSTAAPTQTTQTGATAGAQQSILSGSTIS